MVNHVRLPRVKLGNATWKGSREAVLPSYSAAWTCGFFFAQ
jgi:hypothetical protein